jgi:predicted DsbA family dithiol-disulfide isomerase
MAPIEVFADACCPFTHLGLSRFVDRRRALGQEEPRLYVRAWPLELVNGVPLDAAFIEEEVDELRRQVAPDLFAGFDRSAFPPSSMPAFALAAVAYRRDLATGEAVSLALRDALFEDGRNIADPAVLAEISERHDLGSPTAADRRRALEDWHDGRAREVVGSPHFFIAGRSLFCPSLDIAKVDGHLRIATKEDGLTAMLEAALGR